MDVGHTMAQTLLTSESTGPRAWTSDDRAATPTCSWVVDKEYSWIMRDNQPYLLKYIPTLSSSYVCIARIWRGIQVWARVPKTRKGQLREIWYGAQQRLPWGSDGWAHRELRMTTNGQSGVRRSYKVVWKRIPTRENSVYQGPEARECMEHLRNWENARVAAQITVCSSCQVSLVDLPGRNEKVRPVLWKDCSGSQVDKESEQLRGACGTLKTQQWAESTFRLPGGRSRALP